MKTNHGRGFTARQDFRPGWRMLHSQGFKAASARGMRVACKRALDMIRTGTDPDVVVFRIQDEVEDRWSWD